MGTVASILPKNIVLQQPEANWEMPQGPRNIGFKNAMAPPGQGDGEGEFTNTRLRCSGASIICEKRVIKDGVPTNDWQWADATQRESFVRDATCQTALNEFGDPCMARGRALPVASKGPMAGMFDFKNWGTKQYLIAGTAAILLVGVVAIVASKKKA